MATNIFQTPNLANDSVTELKLAPEVRVKLSATGGFAGFVTEDILAFPFTTTYPTAANLISELVLQDAKYTYLQKLGRDYTAAAATGGKLTLTALAPLPDLTKIQARIQYVSGAGAATGGSGTTTPLVAPTGLNQASSTTSSVTLVWNASANATGYRLLRGGNVIVATGITALTYTDTGLGAGTTPSYQVQAIGTGNYSDSPYSTLFQATVQAAGSTESLSIASVTGSGGTRTVNVTTNSTKAISYSKDGGATLQSSPKFTGLAIGNYTFYAQLNGSSPLISATFAGTVDYLGAQAPADGSVLRIEQNEGRADGLYPGSDTIYTSPGSASPERNDPGFSGSPSTDNVIFNGGQIRFKGKFVNYGFGYTRIPGTGKVTFYANGSSTPAAVLDTNNPVNRADYQQVFALPALPFAENTWLGVVSDGDVSLDFFEISL